jgi:hypothetical protein
VTPPEGGCRRPCRKRLRPLRGRGGGGGVPGRAPAPGSERPRRTWPRPSARGRRPSGRPYEREIHPLFILLSSRAPIIRTSIWPVALLVPDGEPSRGGRGGRIIRPLRRHTIHRGGGWGRALGWERLALGATASIFSGHAGTPHSCSFPSPEATRDPGVPMARPDRTGRACPWLLVPPWPFRKGECDPARGQGRGCGTVDSSARPQPGPGQLR